MKKLLVLLFSINIILFHKIKAQCGDRYVNKIFSTVNKTENIEYGTALSPAGVSTTLVMDVYEPVGDTFAQRPLIIFAHGGSFITGNENMPDCTYLCTEFAKRGYVTASISYRLYDIFGLPDSLDMFDVVVKAVQDYKGSIRYFRADRSTANLFKIDTSQIFIGGVSAGAVAAIHAAYMDSEDDIPDYINTIITSNGGIEGASGSTGYSSHINGVINICGAIGNDIWIGSDEAPICSFHGTEDDVLPYGSGCADIGFGCITTVDGSSIIHSRAMAIGINSFLRTHSGAGHVPFGAGPYPNAYMDTTENDIVNWLAPLTLCDPGVPAAILNESIDAYIYSENKQLYISSIGTYEVKLYNVMGVEVWNDKFQDQYKTSLSQWSEGIYLMVLKNSYGGMIKSKMYIE